MASKNGIENFSFENQPKNVKVMHNAEKFVKVMHTAACSKTQCFHEKIRQNNSNFAQRDASKYGIKNWHQFFSLGKKLMPNFDASR